MNNPEETILRLLATLFSTSSEDPFPGRACPADPRPRSTLTSRRRRRRPPSRSSAEISLRSSKSSCTTVVASASPRTLTMATSSAYSKAAWRDTSSTLAPLTSSGTRTDWCSRRKPSSDRWSMSSRRSLQPRNQRTARKAVPLLAHETSKPYCKKSDFIR